MEKRENYKHFTTITTRWRDNDIYGHVNNVVYYSYFDSAVNEYLINFGGLDIQKSPIIGVVVESKCQYKQSLAYPEKVEVGLRADKIGNRSVTYGIGIFKEGEEEVAAYGYFTHVFVERESNTPVLIPEKIRIAMETLV